MGRTMRATIIQTHARKATTSTYVRLPTPSLTVESATCGACPPVLVGGLQHTHDASLYNFFPALKFRALLTRPKLYSSRPPRSHDSCSKFSSRDGRRDARAPHDGIQRR